MRIVRFPRSGKVRGQKWVRSAGRKGRVFFGLAVQMGSFGKFGFRLVYSCLSVFIRGQLVFLSDAGAATGSGQNGFV